MLNKMNIEKNIDGSCNILICYSSVSDTEFSLDFLSYDKLKSNVNGVCEFVKKTSSKMKVKAVKIIINGVIISTMSLSSFMNIYGADTSKYSMAYIQTLNVSQQISYIDRTNGSLNTISPSYFNIVADGSLSVSSISAELINNVHSKNMKVIPFLSNHWDRSAGEAALANAENLSTEIANYISQYNLDGVNVDIENVNETQRDLYTSFVAKLREKIPVTKEVSVAVAANPGGWTDGWHGSYDYTNLAKNSDYLMMMTYDEHWNGSDAGPVASISFVENSIKYALTKTTPDKIVIGLPFYGRIWSDGGLFKGEGITLDRVSEMVGKYRGTVTYDNSTQSAKAVFTINPTDSTTTLNGKTLTKGVYTIWYENETSIQAKMALITKYNLKGVGAWSLGQEPSTIWQNYSKWLNNVVTVPPTPTLPPTIAVKTGIVNATKLNVRTSPSTKAKVLTTIKKNSSVTIQATKNGWNTVKLPNGQTGYVSSAYISEKIVSPPKTTTTSTTKKGIVTVPILNVRSSASTRSKIITGLRKNSTVTITATKNGWHTIRLANGQTGYVLSSYVKTI